MVVAAKTERLCTAVGDEYHGGCSEGRRVDSRLKWALAKGDVLMFQRSDGCVEIDGACWRSQCMAVLITAVHIGLCLSQMYCLYPSQILPLLAAPFRAS